MDEHKSPQDFLNEIFEKGQTAPPSPPPLLEQPPRDDPPPALPTGGPTEKRETEAGAKLLPWLGVMLGAALLVLGVCLFQLTRMGHRLDGLQQAVEAAKSVDSLRKENEQLQEQLDQREQAYDQLWQTLQDISAQSNTASIQKLQLGYLWYMGQFMEHGDYPMAALAVMLSARGYFSADITFGPQQTAFLNPEYTEQYQAYTQELVDRGYLDAEPAFTYGDRIELSEIPDTPYLTFPDQWDPAQNPDMAALGILWCALDKCYVAGVPEIAAQYLLEYQWYALYAPGETDGPRYPQRILDAASEYTIRQYQRLLQDLTETGWVVETGGTLLYGEGQGSTDVLYGLPFDPPGGYLYGEIPLN